MVEDLLNEPEWICNLALRLIHNMHKHCINEAVFRPRKGGGGRSKRGGHLCMSVVVVMLMTITSAGGGCGGAFRWVGKKE